MRETGVTSFVLHVDGIAHPQVFPSAKSVRAFCWREYNHVPIHAHGDEIGYDSENPTHAALRHIEARHSGWTEIVAVGSKWYLVTKSRFGAEFKVNYEVRDGIVHARNDFEPIGGK